MQYRKFGNTGIEISAIGFGAMRFPLKEDKTVDVERAVAMLRQGIDGGMNYVDTAYPYHDGESERLVGEALKDGYREKVYLATKCPVWLLEKDEDFDRILDEQLAKLQTDRIDCYLLHGLGKERLEERVKKFNLVEKAVKAKEEGKIRWLGFSFHDSLEVFREIVDYTDQWDFCQIQYNYINTDAAPGIEGLKYAAEKGLGVIVMEPLLGGKLANLAPHVAECFPEDKTAVEYGLDFLWDQPEVSFVLSGMSDEQQVEDNLRYADRSAVGMLTKTEQAYYKKAKEIFDRMALVNCTKCRYCMPCAFGLDIPEIFAAYNLSAAAGNAAAKKAYEVLEKKAEDCRTCRKCEKECPQHIEISAKMKEAAGFFAKL